MKLVAYRFGLTLGAIIVGILLVFLLTYLGQKSSGPIDDALVAVGKGVSSYESEVILNNRQHTRSKSLLWFDTIRNNPALLKIEGKLLLGAYDNETSETYQSIVELEDSLHTKLPFIHLYTAWGSKPEEQFPYDRIMAIREIGSMPVITWEPWLADFDAQAFPAINPIPAKRDKNCLKYISRGDYDAYIDAWAKEAKAVQFPIFVRLGHEMNDPYRYPWGPQNNKAEDYIAAWRHVVKRFRDLGATNVLWVWSPHPAYGYFDAYYPGSAYVDWVGVGTLNYGTVAPWSKWWTFDEIFGHYYADLSKYQKPIMLTEFGSLSIGGDRAKWYSDALKAMPLKYKAVKSVIFFHSSNDNTTTYKALNWYVKDDSGAVKAIVEALELGK